MTHAIQSTSSLILSIGLLIAAAVAVRAFLDCEPAWKKDPVQG